MRVEIEDIDHDDVKLKLNAAVAKTTKLQSKEKKRIVAQDEKLFSKYTEKDSDGELVAGQVYQSPADIAAVSKPAAVSKQATASKDSTSVTVSKSSSVKSDFTKSPKTSPRAPANSYQFQKDWKSIKNDQERTYEYLKVSFAVYGF